MRKLWLVLVLAILLTGCAGEQETVTDTMDVSAMAQMQTVTLTLPKGASVQTMENGDGEKLYLCDGYTVAVQTLSGGDLDKTLREITGFSKEQLTVMERASTAGKRYDCVWTSAGEGEDQVARGVVLDDGNYHYAVTVMAPFSVAGDLSETWQDILASVQFNTD